MAAALPGAELFLKNRFLFWDKPLVLGSCAAWGRTFFSKCRLLFEEATYPGQLRCQGQIFFQKSDCFKNMTSTISKHALSESLGARFAEQNVGNLKKKLHFQEFSPMRRAKRRTSQNMHFQEFWDSCAQNKTPEISKCAFLGILGLLCAEEYVGNLKKIVLAVNKKNIWFSHS